MMITDFELNNIFATFYGLFIWFNFVWGFNGFWILYTFSFDKPNCTIAVFSLTRK